MAEYEANKSNNLFDSVEFHALQTYAGGDYEADLELILTFAEGAPLTLDYLEDRGFPWKPTVRTYLGALWPRSHESSEYKSGQGFIETYVKTIESNKYPVEYLLTTSATDLIFVDDVVIGVKATSEDGTQYELSAKKGVIIASGGFAASPEMRKKYAPSLLETLPTTNTPSNTGDGILMAEKIGANLVGMDAIQCLPVCDPVDGRTGSNIGPSSGMMINKEGVRFVNEDERRDVITNTVLKQTDALFYVLCNEPNTMLDENNKNKNGQDIKDLLEQEKVIKGDTIEELAQKLGMDPSVLKSSIEKFNLAFEKGYDEEFGRVNYDEYVDLSAGGPYYATPRSPSVHHTMGGIQINSKCEVLNTEGKIIKNLFAAGEVTGGIHGSNRLGANAIPDVLTFGRIAGESAAKTSK